MQRTSPSISPIIDAVQTEEPRLLLSAYATASTTANHLTEVVWLSGSVKAMLARSTPLVLAFYRAYTC